MMMNWWPGGYGGGLFGLGMLLPTLFWLAILAGLFLWLRSYLTDNTRVMVGQHNSLETLKERYAKGEISKEEYLSMRKDLED